MVSAHTAKDPLSARSPFLRFVAREFSHGRGTEDRRLLSSKKTAHAEVRKLGLRCPERHLVIHDLDAVKPADLPDRCVLKLSGGWSARGVMPVERLGAGLWFDHLALRSRRWKQIAERQRKVAASFGMTEPAWFVEEMVESTVAGKPIPLDYKFYCFRDRIGLVVQIDRNVTPARICLLREDFTPFVEGRDYALGSANAQPGQAAVPLNAPSLVYWAKLLSLRTDAPFVSVDLYDSPQGPVFGEFTFSPGGTHCAMWRYSEEMLARLDALFAAGSDATVGAFRAEADDPAALPRPRPEVYARLAAAVLGSSSRAADRLAEFYAGAARTAAAGRAEHQADALAALGRSWTAIRDAMRAQQRRRTEKARVVAAPWDTDQRWPDA